jgi:hypothetical protein
MAYVLILRRNQDDDLGLPLPQMHERFVAWTRSLAANDRLKAVERLKPAAQAVTLTQHGDGVEISGRYPGTEDVIGYYLIDVGNMQEARDLAEGCPILAVGGSVEIRETEPFQAD